MHSETIEIDYDPSRITYNELLEVFWRNHSPVGAPLSRQYASIIFYHDEEQRRLAERRKEQEQEERGRQISTEIVPHTQFWLAEDYHQKYHLRGEPDLTKELEAIYPDIDDFLDSTAVARVNGYVGGHGTMEQFQAEIESLGLSAEGQEKLQAIANRRLR